MGGEVMNNTLSYLNTTVLSTLCKCLVEGDYNLIESMGVNPHSIEKLKNLSLSSTQLLGKAPWHVLSITIDDIALNHYLEYLEKRRKQQKLIDNLILADAPSSYMHEQFGIRREEYVRIRHTLGMTPPDRGRPSIPEKREVVAEALYRAQEKTEDGIIDPQNILMLSQKQKVSVRQLLALDNLIICELAS